MFPDTPFPSILPATNPAERPIPPIPPIHAPTPRPAAVEPPHALETGPRWRGERYQSANKLAGLVALVTGGASGLGRSVAYLFAREGADLAITTVPEEFADATVTQAAIESLGRRCVLFEGDLTDAAYCDRVVDETERALGRLDVLVHNAAWQSQARAQDAAEDALDRTMDLHVYPYLRLARAASPRMRPGSSIIATSSVAGNRGAERLGDYAATKGAIHSITQSLAKELAGLRIRVNTVAPGPVVTATDTSSADLAPAEVASFGLDAAPTDPSGHPEDVAPAFVFLASDADARCVSGSMIVIAGWPA